MAADLAARQHLQGLRCALPNGLGGAQPPARTFPGVIVRGEFYRFALKRCGRNVVVEFGTVFIYRDVSVGSNVLIGRYNTIHHCDFGDYVLTAEGCAFLSGSRYHRHEALDTPMALQGGEKKRITIGDDCWIGARAVVMRRRLRLDRRGGIDRHRPVEPYSIVAGNPARLLRPRGKPETTRTAGLP